MNGDYYQNPIFPGLNQPSNNYPIPNNTIMNNDIDINNILKNNNNKKVTLYISKENVNKPISGIIERTSKDNIIIYNPEDGKYYLIPTNNINYIIFEEKIN